jgi:peptide deformylase
MTVRQILKMGDDRLLRVAQAVPEPGVAVRQPWMQALLQDLRDTMAAANGAGLAAPQIGEDWQVVMFGSGQVNPRYPDAPIVPPTVLINPVIEPLGDAMLNDWEGCLSVPGLRGRVPRYARIRYSGWGEQGERIERTVEGFHARVVQHECDHLIGRLYPTRMTDLTQLGYTEVLFPALGDSAAADD